MTTLSQHKAIHASYLAGAIVLFMMPDILFELLTSLVQFLFESFMTVVEYLEIYLEYVVKHTLHTDQQTTQIIVFYSIIAWWTFVMYQLWRCLYFSIRKIKNSIIANYRESKASAKEYWSTLSILNKFKVIGFGVMGFTFIVMFGL
jgi:hypothetical protein